MPDHPRNPGRVPHLPRRTQLGEAQLSPRDVPDVTDAAFFAEARELGALPAGGPPEIAIAGRSNVGKSTLLNRLAARRGLARTSKTPGRTRGLVIFTLRLARAPIGELRLVDLPGYGYARVGKGERESWGPLIEGYTRRRPSLALFVMLVDSRRGLEDEERQLYQWLGTENVPAQVVFTKVDKLSASERGLLKAKGRTLFRGRAPIFASGETGEGIPQLWSAVFEAVAALGPAAGATDQEP